VFGRRGSQAFELSVGFCAGFCAAMPPSLVIRKGRWTSRRAVCSQNTTAEAACHHPLSKTPNSLYPKAQPLIRNNQRSKLRKRPTVCWFQIDKQLRAAPTSPSRVMCCGNWSAASGCARGVFSPTRSASRAAAHKSALASQRHPRAETHNNIRGGRARTSQLHTRAERTAKSAPNDTRAGEPWPSRSLH
jgi:hypothetical protein